MKERLNKERILIRTLDIHHLDSFEQSLYTAQQTRDIDKLAIASVHKGDGFALMTKAGRSLFNHACDQFPMKKRWLIFCGGGNNGGDGYVAARLASEENISVTVIQIGKVDELDSELKGEALEAYKTLNTYQVEHLSFDDFIRLYDRDGAFELSEDLIIDAMLGTGLSGTVNDRYQSAIDWINSSSIDVLAVDIPSGLSSDTGIPLGRPVKACQTLTFIGINKGLVTSQAKAFTGQLFYDELGIPTDIKSKVQSDCHLLSTVELKGYLFKRSKTDHKGDSGRGLFIGGSDGTSGAALLSCEAALRAGVGLLVAITGKNAVAPLLTRTPEAMVRHFSDALVQQINEFGRKADAIAIGPGLAVNENSRLAVETVLQLGKPTLLDADALNLIACSPDIWQMYGHKECVLTPHPLEASRLLGCTVADVENDRFKAINRLVCKYQCTVLLKGSGTLISSSSNNVVVSYLGNESLATGGMGDVLSGMILAFLAKSKNCFESTKLAAFVQSICSEMLSENGIIGVLPSDIINNQRLVINETLAK